MNDQIKPSTESGELNSSVEQDLPSLGLRATYLLERDRIRGDIGDLAQILATLGMSQRKACQLLLVDPSAWTRWSKTGAPPHIYQALKWLIQLKKLNPEAVGPSDLSARLDFVQSQTSSKLRVLEENIGYLEKKLVLAHQLSSVSGAAEANAPSMLREIKRLNRIVEQLQEKLDRLVVKAPIKRKKQKMKPKTKTKVHPRKSGKKIVKKKTKKRVQKRAVKTRGSRKSKR